MVLPRNVDILAPSGHLGVNGRYIGSSNLGIGYDVLEPSLLHCSIIQSSVPPPPDEGIKFNTFAHRTLFVIPDVSIVFMSSRKQPHVALPMVLKVRMFTKFRI